MEIEIPSNATLVVGDEDHDVLNIDLHSLSLYFPTYTRNNLTTTIINEGVEEKGELSLSNPFTSQRPPYYYFILSIIQLTSLLLPLLFMSFLIIFLVYFFSLTNCHPNLITEITSYLFFHFSIQSYQLCCIQCLNPYLLSLFLCILVILLTYSFMIIFLFKKQFYLNLLCGISFILPCCLLTYAITIQFCIYLQIPLDFFTFFFLLWNLIVAIPFFLFNNFIHIHIFRNICIIYTSISISWIIFSLSEITIGIFCLLMILWDIFAVFHPLGPINIILKQRQYWIYMAQSTIDIPNGLSYKTSNYELGTGDIIFLGVLIGRGCMTREVYTIVCCISAVIMGYIVACIQSISMKRTVPALPGALGIGLLVYILCRVFNPQNFINDMIHNCIYM